MIKKISIYSIALIITTQLAIAQAGIDWTIQSSPVDNRWNSVTYGNGLFVAVSSYNNQSNNVMTSSDGVNWTIQTAIPNRAWSSVCFGNGLFVAVEINTSGARAMTSTDGINWTLGPLLGLDGCWNCVTYGNGLYVAVANCGTPDKLITSSNGINWTQRNTAANTRWNYVTFGNGLFVAVTFNGTSNRVMTSPDGINWTSRISAADNYWNSVTYGNGLFVAVAASGSGNRVMTSPDGINWTSRNSAADINWSSITYGSGLFVAVANSGTGNRVMTSPDGINWTLRNSAADNTWSCVTYANGIFVSVATSGFGNRVMTSGNFTTTPITLLNLTATYNNKNANIINWQTSQEVNSKSFTIQKAYTAGQFANIATMPAAGNSSTIKSYTYTDNNIEYKPTYYRLLQTDIDGKTTYSKTVMVTPYKNSFTIGRLYPNPAHNNLTVEYNSNNNSVTTLSITDMLGRQVQKNMLSSVHGFNKQQINVAKLAKGKYSVTLISNGQRVQSEFVKE